MRQKRFPMIILALFLACILAIALARAGIAMAEQPSGGGPPVTFILDDMISSHEQDIREKMFEYKFEAASGDPDKQAGLVVERSDELKREAEAKKGFLQALISGNSSLPDGQLMALADDTNVSLEKLNGRSKKLEEHAAGLAMLKGHGAYTDTVRLTSEINEAKGLVSKAKKAAGNKANNDKAGPKK